jgi:hypothetical protein
LKIVQATGQTCNQFWIYSNFLADAIEKNEKFAIWVPDLNFEYFPNLLNSNYIVFPLYSKLFVNFFGFHKYIKFLNFIFNKKNTLSVFKFLIEIVTIHNFEIADVTVKKSLFKYKHSENLILSFRPEQLLVKATAELICNIRKSNKLVIGIHFRRGDYKTYENGKYYYSNSQYAIIMKQVENLFHSKNIAFLLLSNEEIDRSFFVGYNCYFSSSNLMAQDLYLLSQADYILGPPSTFSAWASLYNNSPVYFIENPDLFFSLKEFIDIKSIWF